MSKKLYKNKIRMNKAKHVRLLLARVINQLDEDIIDVEKARAFGYLAGKVIDAFKATEFEDRLEKIEELVAEE